MTYCEICTNAFSSDDFADCPHCALAEGLSLIHISEPTRH